MTQKIRITNRFFLQTGRKIARTEKTLVDIIDKNGKRIGFINSDGTINSVAIYNDLGNYLSTFIGTNRDFYTVQKRQLLVQQIKRNRGNTILSS